MKSFCIAFLATFLLAACQATTSQNRGETTTSVVSSQTFDRCVQGFTAKAMTPESLATIADITADSEGWSEGKRKVLKDYYETPEGQDAIYPQVKNEAVKRCRCYEGKGGDVLRYAADFYSDSISDADFEAFLKSDMPSEQSCT